MKHRTNLRCNSTPEFPDAHRDEHFSLVPKLNLNHNRESRWRGFRPGWHPFKVARFTFHFVHANYLLNL